MPEGTVYAPDTPSEIAQNGLLMLALLLEQPKVGVL